MTTSQRRLAPSEVLHLIQLKAKEVLPNNARLRLYGSRATNLAHEDSDWDLHIVLNRAGRQTVEDIDRYATPFAELGWSIGEEINALVYTTEEWQKRRILPFYQDVETEGIDLCH